MPETEMWISKPKNALIKYILPEFFKPKWIEDSKPISESLNLKRRELFGLINLATIYSTGGIEWRVGFDPTDGEPNDGFITPNRLHKSDKRKFRKVMVEHKIVAQFEKREVLKAILETYKKNAARGASYGENRVLIIHPNKESDHGGLIKISDLTDLINEESPFDKVFSLALVGKSPVKEDCIVIHMIQHYPKDSKEEYNNNGIMAIELNLRTGELICLTNEK